MAPDARTSAAAPAPTATRRCALRVDANERIGIGHLTRCLTLATRLRARGVACRFVCRALPEPLHRLVEGHGFPVDALPATPAVPVDDDGPAHRDWLGAGWREDAEQTADVLAAWGVVDVLVVDHYAIDRRWQQRVRRQVRLVAVVDDLADRPHDCELLLDQGFFPDPARRYAGRIPVVPHLASSVPAHALLRPEFAEAAARRRERDGHVRRLLIGYGGSDAGDLTGTTVDALAPHWRGGSGSRRRRRRAVPASGSAQRALRGLPRRADPRADAANGRTHRACRPGVRRLRHRDLGALHPRPAVGRA
ncbi:MAG: UDP-2,4-diacetamido-2,4,6-trideoxy-beta-L-altropyranose hydrolase [Comamonadaceae bacterium]|nr:UDP-2,4-diacetamido-2,4,6-trideoxy-beta-L-altropyranose hydrolase [Comamonadaceae bacterium]